ncbi:MAG TPA: shikimate kinase [Bacteroidota bacterium]|nr:shikimate kinase [Bacteroidota bacterium]
MDEAVRRSIVFLTGFMGSGKSTIGPILANTIGYSFTDLDLLIEERDGRKIGDIFKEDGEERFREIERTFLSEVARKPRTVISLGGGTIANQTNLDLVKGSGVLIYLKAEPEYIYKRLRTKSDRPMLRTAGGDLMDSDQLQHRIEELLAGRKEYYEQAHIIIHTDDKKIGNTIDELVKTLRHHIED